MMNKPIKMYNRNAAVYQPGVAGLLDAQASTIKTQRAENEALRSSNAKLLKAVAQLQDEKKSVKEIWCAAGCMVIAVAIVLVMGRVWA